MNICHITLSLRAQWWPLIAFRTSLSHALTSLTLPTSSFPLYHHLCIALPHGLFFSHGYSRASTRALSLHLPLKLHSSTLLLDCLYLNLSCSVSGGQWALHVETFCDDQASYIIVLSSREMSLGLCGAWGPDWVLCSVLSSQHWSVLGSRRLPKS